MPKRSKRTLAESLAKTPSIKTEKHPMTLDEVYRELDGLRGRLYDLTHRIAAEGVAVDLSKDRDGSMGVVVRIDDVPF